MHGRGIAARETGLRCSNHATSPRRVNEFALLADGQNTQQTRAFVVELLNAARPSMSAMGQKRTRGHGFAMSALPPKTGR
jgi:hypothetical protein